MTDEELAAELMSAAVAKHERWQALAAEPEVRRKAAEEAEAKRKAEEEERARAEEAERKRIEAEERKRIAKGDRELAKAYDRCKKYPEALEILRDDQPHDIYEAVSVALSGHKILLNNDGVRRGYKHETGLGEGERKRFFRMFATRENGGISIARLAEDIVQEICDVNGIRYDNNDARGIIIEMLASSDGPSDIYNYIRNRRIEQANSIVDHYEYEEECSLREDFWYEMHMTPEEWDAYNDYREEELKELDNHFRDFDFSEHYANIAERIEKEYANGKDINRKGESDAEGGGDQANVPVGTLVRGEGLPKEGGSGEVSTGFENVKKDLLRSSDHGERLDREATGEGSDVGIGQAELGNGGVSEDGDGKTDNQGNPLNADGTLKLEKITSIDELRDEDFSAPTRNVELPALPRNVDEAIGANGKPVIIKKNIFERNAKHHAELTAEDSRNILQSALYNANLYGQNQKAKRPYNWVVINTKDKEGNNRLVLIELSSEKENAEIVHWYYLRDESLETIKRQAEREGGHILILPSEGSEEAGGLSSRTPDLSSNGKGNTLSSEKQDADAKNGDGVEDYAEMDEYVPQTWDENSSLRDVEARLKLLEDAFYYPWEALGKKIFPDAEQLHAEAKALVDKYGGRDRIPKEEEDALAAKYADHLARQDAMREEIYSLRELRDRLEAKMSREKLEEIERQKKADQLAKYNGYLRGRGNLQASSIDRNLSKKKRIDGEVATVAEFIERWLADGSLNVSTYNYRPQINRRRWNRMSSQEQAAWEASHDKLKTEYLVNDYDLGKTAYDYARWLLSQKEKGKLGGGKQKERRIVDENGGDVVKEQKGAGTAEVKDSFERYRGRNPRARQLSLFGDDSKVKPEARQLSLFDDTEVDGSGRIIEPERQAEMDRNAEKVNSSLDEFTDEYAEYLRMLDETEGSEDFVPEEAEARVMDLRDKLVEDMMEYHRSAGMSEAEARKRSWELVNQTMTDINIALLRKGKAGNIELLPEETIKVKRMNESEEAKEWLPELGEGEFCYMERKFSEDKSFVFSAPEHIESMDDVAYIFKQLEKYSVEHSFLALVKDGKVTVVHLGMGNATSAIVNMAAARAALDKFDPDMVYFVHNHPSGVLTASIPDVDSLQTLRDMTKGKVECEALIIDTLSGKYAQFGLDGHSRILDLPKGFDNEVDVKVQAHDKMEYAPDFTPDKKEQTNSAGDIVKYVSSLRVGTGDKVGVLVMNQQNHILANLYLPMEEDMRVLGDDIAGKVVRFGGNRVIVYTNNGQMLEVGKTLEDAIKRRSGNSVRLLDVLRLKKDGDYQALSESVFEAEGEYGEKGGSNDRYRDSDEIDKEYPSWLDGTINDSGKHSTQVEGTRKTYNKVADWIENNIGKNVSILDASSGMGYGTGDLRERGFDIEDVEPYQSEDRKKNNPATYDSYDKISKQYDYIISNAVLNVIPDDWRANVLHDMARCLKPGGRMFINTRKAGEEKYIKDKIELDSPQEILVKRNGKIASYQRFFTPRELQRWVQEELGADYSVEIANERNSGTKGLAAVVVTKNNGSPANSEASGLGQPIRYNEDAPVANFDAKLRKLSERTKRLDAIISFIREGNKLGSHEFLHELNNAMLLSNRRSTNSSNYVNLGSGVTLRISNHYANVDSFRRNNNLHDNYGIVIKLSPSRFKDDPKVDYLEYVYFPDKLTKERQLDILNGLKSFMSSGRYESLPEPDKVNASGIYKEKHANPTSMDQVDMRSEAERLSEELNTPVRIITDAEEAASLPTVRQRRAKGFWSEKDGIVVILSNHKDVADVAGTVLHEIVGHDGLRVLFP